MSATAPGDAAVVPFPSPIPLGSVQGSLALDLTPRLEPPRPALRAAGAWDVAEARIADRQRLDDFVARFLQGALEIAIGDRPASQALRHCSAQVHARLVAGADLVQTLTATPPGQGRGPGRIRPMLASVRTSLVRADALEACARVRYGQRSRAVAARFEVVQQRWQCVELDWR